MNGPGMPIIHQYQVSPFAAKVRRCLYYKGVEFRVVNYGLTGVRKLKKLNPRSKAPVLEHGGKLVPDSTDIIRYLDAAFPDRPVIPADPAASALAHILEDWADESLYFYDLTMRSWPNNAALLADDLVIEDRGLLRRLLHRVAPAIIARQAHGQGTGRKEKPAVCDEVGAHFRAIDTLLADNAWLAGNMLSVADIAVASMLTVLERAEEARASMAGFPLLGAWRERVDAATLPAGTPPDQRALA